MRKKRRRRKSKFHSKAQFHYVVKLGWRVNGRIKMSTCRGCWWDEGGRCYVDNPPRNEKGRSLVKAEKRCGKYQSKRAMLSTVIPDEKLIIISEYVNEWEGK